MQTSSVLNAGHSYCYIYMKTGDSYADIFSKAVIAKAVLNFYD